MFNQNELQNRFNCGEVIELASPTVVLASASPRRSRLLDAAGIKHVKVVSTVNDSELNYKFAHDGIGESQAVEYVEQMALAKLAPFVGKIKNGAVITADTIIYCDGKILEKPLTVERCREQHEFISGKTNINYTGYAVYYNGKKLSRVMPTKVSVDVLPKEIIEQILLEPEILDCAGYRNQGNISNYLRFD